MYDGFEVMYIKIHSWRVTRVIHSTPHVICRLFFVLCVILFRVIASTIYLPIGIPSMFTMEHWTWSMEVCRIEINHQNLIMDHNLVCC